MAKVRKTLIVRYPIDELPELIDFLSRWGGNVSISDDTGLAYRTIKRVADTGKGRYETVSKIREYISGVKKLLALKEVEL